MVAGGERRFCVEGTAYGRTPLPALLGLTLQVNCLQGSNLPAGTTPAGTGQGVKIPPYDHSSEDNTGNNNNNNKKRWRQRNEHLVSVIIYTVQVLKTNTPPQNTLGLLSPL